MALSPLSSSLMKGSLSPTCGVEAGRGEVVGGRGRWVESRWPAGEQATAPNHAPPIPPTTTRLHHHKLALALGHNLQERLARHVLVVVGWGGGLEG